jgi:hypothetical protein
MKPLWLTCLLAGATVGGIALGGVVAGWAHPARPAASLAAAEAAPAASAVFEVAPVAASATSDFRRIGWDELAPKDWDPMKQLRGTDVSALADADPRAVSMLKEMREVWDHAPANAEMDGQRIRIAGYLVPLDETPAGLKQFLLVPYFGACIHTPPPPANQIIDVTAAVPAKDLHAMDAVWVSGVLRTTRSDTLLGITSYRMDGLAIERYEPAHSGKAG